MGGNQWMALTWSAQRSFVTHPIWEDLGSEILYGKVPLKVKNLVWRICHDWCTTWVRLNNRGIACPYECVFCGDVNEDSLHVLFTCPQASRIWQAVNLWNDVDNVVNECDNSATIVFYLLDWHQPS